MNRFFKYGLIIGFLCPALLLAQNTPGLWSGVSAAYKLNKKFDLSSEFQLRTGEHFSFRKAFFESEVNYDLSKPIDVFLSYRASLFNNADTDLLMKHNIGSTRITFGMKANILDQFLKNKDWDNFSIKLRFQGQYEVQKFAINDFYWRTKLGFGYKIKSLNLEPNFSLEAFYHVNHQFIYYATEVRRVGALDEWRFNFGLDWKINKQLEAGMSFIFQNDLFDLNDNRIFKIGLKYSIDKIGKKK